MLLDSDSSSNLCVDGSLRHGEVKKLVAGGAGPDIFTLGAPGWRHGHARLLFAFSTNTSSQAFSTRPSLPARTDN